jgi:predicted nucleic acid-binding protein
VNVLVDTSVWSLALRRKPEDLNRVEQTLVSELTEIIHEGRARILGPVRQELLTGMRDPSQFERLRTTLRAFPDEPLSTEDYELAAKASNLCRSKGLVVSTVDALICATTASRSWSVMTIDPDFARYATLLPIQLHVSRS